MAAPLEFSEFSDPLRKASERLQGGKLLCHAAILVWMNLLFMLQVLTNYSIYLRAGGVSPSAPILSLPLSLESSESME